MSGQWTWGQLRWATASVFSHIGCLCLPGSGGFDVTTWVSCPCVWTLGVLPEPAPALGPLDTLGLLPISPALRGVATTHAGDPWAGETGSPAALGELRASQAQQSPGTSSSGGNRASCWLCPPPNESPGPLRKNEREDRKGNRCERWGCHE